MQCDETAKLTVVDGKLYWDGKPVRTGINLEGWSLAALWITAAATVVIAIGTIVMAFRS